MEMLVAGVRLRSEHQTTNLGVGSSNLSGRASFLLIHPGILGRTYERSAFPEHIRSRATLAYDVAHAVRGARMESSWEDC